MFALSLLLVFQSGRASVHDGRSRIHLKHGGSLSFTVASVHPWGVRNAQGETAIFSVMDSLITSDSLLAQNLAQADSGIVLRETSPGYLLDFTRYVSPRRSFEEVRPLTVRSLSIFYRTDAASSIAVHVDGRLFESGGLFHRFQSSVGFRDGRTVFNSLNFAFGMGFETVRSGIRISAAASVGVFGGIPETDSRPRLSPVCFLSPMITLFVAPDYRAAISFGADLFLYRSTADLPNGSVIFFMGLCKDLP